MSAFCIAFALIFFAELGANLSSSLSGLRRAIDGGWSSPESRSPRLLFTSAPRRSALPYRSFCRKPRCLSSSAFRSTSSPPGGFAAILWTTIATRTTPLGALGLITSAFFLSELGDNTQLATISIAGNQYAFIAVWLGSTMGMVAADALAIAVGVYAGRRIPERILARLAAASSSSSGPWPSSGPSSPPN